MSSQKKVLIVIPCYNEELVLEQTIFSVMHYAEKNLSQYDWKILIVDNASKDGTWMIARKMSEKYAGIVSADQILIPGRGITLKKIFQKYNTYDIYTYMDADLATDIKDFSFIISKVDEGYDFVTGSRYLPHSDVVRTWKRRVLSRTYNYIIQFVLGARFHDAQCGFKAFSKKLVTELVPETEDHGWFWDTELMILASRRGYRVLEVPVSWREVRDELRVSTVSVYSEVVKNLKNIYAMYIRLSSHKHE